MSKLHLGCVKPQLFWLEERPVTKGQEGPTTHILAIQQLSFQKPHPLASGPKQHNLLRVLLSSQGMVYHCYKFFNLFKMKKKKQKKKHHSSSISPISLTPILWQPLIYSLYL